MKIQPALTFATRKLKNLKNPLLESEVLLGALLKKDRTWLKTNTTKTLTLVELLKYSWWLYQRSHHVPTAYITGQTQWSGFNLKVNRYTLIPRDETETLCRHIKQQQLVAPQIVLDVGTGSGCIALYLGQQYRQAKIKAVDVCGAALKVAQKNAKIYGLNVKFKQSDLLESIKPNAHIDLIVANLPYVPEALMVTAEVAKEPRSAIFSGADGLQLIRSLAEQIEDKKISFNQLWLEFLPESKKNIASIFKNYRVDFYPAVNGEIFFACVSLNKAKAK